MVSFYVLTCALYSLLPILGSRCTVPSTTVNPTSTMACRNPSASSKAIPPFVPLFYSAASGSSAEVMTRPSASGTWRLASARSAYRSRSQSAASISWPKKVSCQIAVYLGTTQIPSILLQRYSLLDSMTSDEFISFRPSPLRHCNSSRVI